MNLIDYIILFYFFSIKLKKKYIFIIYFFNIYYNIFLIYFINKIILFNNIYLLMNLIYKEKNSFKKIKIKNLNKF
jgi:hypothetical protein